MTAWQKVPNRLSWTRAHPQLGILLGALLGRLWGLELEVEVSEGRGLRRLGWFRSTWFIDIHKRGDVWFGTCDKDLAFALLDVIGLFERHVVKADALQT